MEKNVLAPSGMVRPEGEPTTPLGKFGQAAIPVAAMLAVPGAQAIGAMGRGVASTARTLTGSEAMTARKAAMGEAHTALGGEVERLGQKAGSLMGESQEAAQAQQAAKSRIASLESPNPKTSLAATGEQTRKLFTEARDAAKAARKEAAAPLYEEASALGKARETSGDRVDVSGAIKPVQEFYDLVKDVPELEPQAKSMLKALGGLKEVEPPQFEVFKPAGHSLMETKVGEGKTLDQLQVVDRYLKKIAYGGELEGFTSISKNAARDASKALGQAMEEFEPAYKHANAEYRRLSEPLDTIGTKYGKSILGTEGGIAKDAFVKVDPSTIPEKMFSKPEGRKQMVHALSGGKNASSEAVAAAQKKVDELTADWLSEKYRQSSSTTAKKALSAPGMHDIMTRGVQERVVPQVTKKSLLEAQAEGAGRATKNLESLSGKVRSKADLISQKLEEAETKMVLGDKTSIKEAYSAYRSALTSAGLSREEFKAANELISRANTVEEKTRIMRKIFGYADGSAAGMGAAGYGLHEVMK
jgi:hypothetical protein